MWRRTLLTLMAFAAIGVFAAPSAQAVQISRNNPYRSYSISGQNYGAVQWELQQRRKAGGSQQYRSNTRYRAYSTPSRGFFRR